MNFSENSDSSVSFVLRSTDETSLHSTTAGSSRTLTKSLSIVEELQDMYKENLRELEQGPAQGDLQLKVNLLQSWVSDLTQQIKLLVKGLKGLGKKEDKDNIMRYLREKSNDMETSSPITLHPTNKGIGDADESVNVKGKEVGPHGQSNQSQSALKVQLNNLQNDLSALLEFIKRRHRSGSGSTNRLNCVEINEADTFEGFLLSDTYKDNLLVQLDMRDKAIEHLEAVIKILQNDLKNAGVNKTPDVAAVQYNALLAKNEQIKSLVRRIQEIGKGTTSKSHGNPSSAETFSCYFSAKTDMCAECETYKQEALQWRERFLETEAELQKALSEHKCGEGNFQEQVAILSEKLVDVNLKVMPLLEQNRLLTGNLALKSEELEDRNTKITELSNRLKYLEKCNRSLGSVMNASTVSNHRQILALRKSIIHLQKKRQLLKMTGKRRTYVCGRSKVFGRPTRLSAGDRWKKVSYVEDEVGQQQRGKDVRQSKENQVEWPNSRRLAITGRMKPRKRIKYLEKFLQEIFQKLIKSWENLSSSCSQNPLTIMMRVCEKIEIVITDMAEQLRVRNKNIDSKNNIINNLRATLSNSIGQIFILSEKCVQCTSVLSDCRTQSGQHINLLKNAFERASSASIECLEEITKEMEKSEDAPYLVKLRKLFACVDKRMREEVVALDKISEVSENVLFNMDTAVLQAENWGTVVTTIHSVLETVIGVLPSPHADIEEHLSMKQQYDETFKKFVSRFSHLKYLLNSVLIVNLSSQPTGDNTTTYVLVKDVVKHSKLLDHQWRVISLLLREIKDFFVLLRQQKARVHDLEIHNGMLFQSMNKFWKDLKDAEKQLSEKDVVIKQLSVN